MPSLKVTILLLALLASSCNAQQQQQPENEPLIASESGPLQAVAQPVQPVAVKQVLMDLVKNAYQMGQASKAYLDTQPEFTQAWADFPYAPGYLPAAFRQSHTPYQQQQSQYKAQGGIANPNSVGFGYIDWSGPVNPASLYVPVNLPYYYRVPPQSVSFEPQQAIYQPHQAAYQPQQAVYQQQPAVYQPVAKAAYVRPAQKY